MKRLFITFIIAALIIGIMSIGCDKETVTGPTEIEYDTTTIIDTVEVPVYTPTTMHAYAVAQKMLEPEIFEYVEQFYNISITSWIGHYSCLWNGATGIVQNNNTFTFEGTITPLFTFAGSVDLYYDIVEYAGFVLVYTGGDPTNPGNWTYSWASSTTTFDSRGKVKF